jgi:hypothetical protein
MITCPSCGAQSSDGSTFCASCGKPISQASSIPETTTTSAATTSAATPSQPTRVITPEAERAMRQAAAQAQGVVKNLGPEKTASIVGGALGLLGAVLPFYSFPNLGDMVDTSSVPTSSLLNQGPVGIVVILLALILGAEPFLTTSSRAISLTSFGLSAAVIGMLLGDHAGFSMLGQSMVPDFGVGYYLAFLGFAILAWVYGQRTFKTA